MWENTEKSSSSFCSFDLSFNLNETSNDDDKSKIFNNNEQINFSSNLSYIETMQNIFPTLESQSLFNEEPLLYRNQAQSGSFLNTDEFDLLGNINKDINPKLGDFYVNNNANNNNNNNSSKNTKRGRGRGSRGSYKPRGGTRSRLSNNQITNPSSHSYASQLPSFPFNNSSSLCSPGSSYITSSSLSNTSQKVCINPEILRRLGYSNVQSKLESFELFLLEY